jgi:hypothetical protein
MTTRNSGKGNFPFDRFKKDKTKKKNLFKPVTTSSSYDHAEFWEREFPFSTSKRIRPKRKRKTCLNLLRLLLHMTTRNSGKGNFPFDFKKDKNKKEKEKPV